VHDHPDVPILVSRIVMMIDTNGREYQCWHELGHAIACLSWGGEVEFVQLLNEGHSVGQAFARCAPTVKGRPMALCGGFAMEFALLRSGRLAVVDEREITQVLFRNATIDREMYWRKPSGAEFSEEEDREFMTVATNLVAPVLTRCLPQVQILVDQLLETQRVSGDKIKEVLAF